MSKGTQPKGFAGLASLVSDVEENDASPAHEAFADDKLGPGSEADHVRDVAKDSSVSAVTEEEDEGRGFSAVSSLSSEAEDERSAMRQGGVESDGRERESETLGAETTSATSAGRNADPSPSREERREPIASHQAKPSRPRSSELKWVLLVVLGMAGLYVYDLVQEEERRAKSDWTFTPETRSATPLPTPAPTSLATQSVAPPPRGAESRTEPEGPVNRARASELEYSQPPVGRDNVLNVAQIRWCLREDIRIETLRTRATTNAEIEQFNRLVSGYNSRCGSYRYRPAALARAQLDVEEQRREIVASTSAAWNSSPVEGPIEPTASSSESGGTGHDAIAESNGVAASRRNVEAVPSKPNARVPTASPAVEGRQTTSIAEPLGLAQDPARSDAVPTSETGAEHATASTTQRTGRAPEVRGTSEVRVAPETVRRAPTDPRQLTREIQEALTALGYEPGPIDSIYGPKTKRAIQAFERAAGLTPAGVATTEVWRMLLGEVSKQEKLNRGSQRRESKQNRTAPGLWESP